MGDLSGCGAVMKYSSSVRSRWGEGYMKIYYREKNDQKIPRAPNGDRIGIYPVDADEP